MDPRESAVGQTRAAGPNLSPSWKNKQVEAALADLGSVELTPLRKQTALWGSAG